MGFLTTLAISLLVFAMVFSGYKLLNDWTRSKTGAEINSRAIKIILVTIILRFLYARFINQNNISFTPLFISGVELINLIVSFTMSIGICLLGLGILKIYNILSDDEAV